MPQHRMPPISLLLVAVVHSAAIGGDPPTMCLDPRPNPDSVPEPDECFTSGDLLEIDVNMGVSPVGVCGAQFFLEYDHENLRFVDILRGTQVGGTTFATQLFESVDEEAGTIDYAIGATLTGCVPEFGPDIIARLQFEILNECVTWGVRFRPHNPDTGYGVSDGDLLIPAGHDPVSGDPVNACDTGPLLVNGSAPVMNCPFESGSVIELNNDCSALLPLMFEPIRAVDACDGEYVPFCDVTVFPPCEEDLDCGVGGTCGNVVGNFCDNPLPFDFTYLVDGGQFPPGRTVIECSATNSCEVDSFCNFEVRRFALTTLIVDLELSPTMASGTAFDPITRCMTFEVRHCGEFPGPESAFEIDDVIVGQPNLPGHGHAVVRIPVGNWNCLRVRDRFHSLAAPCELECVDNVEVLDEDGKVVHVGSVYRAELKGSPDFTGVCHWLIGGNLDGNNVIDIVDFSVFIAQNFTTTDPSTPCDAVPPILFHADINADGVVGILDFSFIAINFFTFDPGCGPICDDPFAAGDSDVGPRPRSSVSIGELRRMGLSDAALRADLNGDGWVDLKDVAIYTAEASAVELHEVMSSRVAEYEIRFGNRSVR